MPKINPDHLVAAVGTRIAELRRAAGLTQAEFAEKLNSSVQYASMVERGTQNLTLAKMAEIANALGVGIEDLIRVPGSKVSVLCPGRRGR